MTKAEVWPRYARFLCADGRKVGLKLPSGGPAQALSRSHPTAVRHQRQNWHGQRQGEGKPDTLEKGTGQNASRESSEMGFRRDNVIEEIFEPKTSRIT